MRNTLRIKFILFLIRLPSLRNRVWRAVNKLILRQEDSMRVIGLKRMSWKTSYVSLNIMISIILIGVKANKTKMKTLHPYQPSVYLRWRMPLMKISLTKSKKKNYKILLSLKQIFLRQKDNIHRYSLKFKTHNSTWEII